MTASLVPWEECRTLRQTDLLNILPQPPTGWVTLCKSLTLSVSVSSSGVSSFTFRGSFFWFVNMPLRSLRLLINVLGVQSDLRGRGV